MLRRCFGLWILLALLVGCSGGGETEKDVAGSDVADSLSTGEVRIAPPQDAKASPDALDDLAEQDLGQDVVAPGCDETPGAFLCPCEANDDCLDGWCIFHRGERICTQLCVEECPDGMVCGAIGVGPDVQYACLSLHPSLCLPCDHSADCPSAGDRCVVGPDGNGAFCGAPCDDDSDCEEAGDFVCQTLPTTEGDEAGQCVPAQGECACSDHAVAQSLGTPCFQSNEWGVCSGWRTCTEDGLTTCDAAAPQEEICGNDVDEDCDTILDDAEVCVICSCDGKECGDDGCGETCGDCALNHVCQIDGTCVCVPNCDGKACGDDGCGNVCGTCDEGELCSFGDCVDGCENDDGCPALTECVDGFCQPDVPDAIQLLEPVTVGSLPGEETAKLSVLLKEAGVTEGAGAGPGLAVQLGFGDLAFDPSTNPQEFLWTDAAYEAEQGDDGETWQATLSSQNSGSYRFTFRASLDGTHWLYADASGLADGYQVEQLGLWHVAFSPVVDTIEPNHGPLLGGQVVTLSGQHFEPGAKLTIDGLEVPCNVADEKTITVTMPAHAAGDVDLSVTNESGLGVGVADGYRYVPRFTPTIDGKIDEWDALHLVGSGDVESNWDQALNRLDSLYVAFDAQYLYFGLAGYCEANNYILGYLDVDFGADSGHANMLALSDNQGDGDLDDAVSNIVHVDVDGFGADMAWGSRGMASFQQGSGLENATFVGWRKLELPYDLAWLQGSVLCSATACEAAIPLETLFGQNVPTNLTTMAAFAKLTDRYGDEGGICNQALPGAAPESESAAVGSVAAFDFWL